MKTILFFAERICEPIERKLDGIYLASAKRNWRIIPVECAFSGGSIAAHLQTWNPGGCIVDCSQPTVQVDFTLFSGYPCVFIDADPEKLGKWRHAVNIDNAAFADIAADELLEHPFEAFAYVGYKINTHWSRKRQECFSARIADAGRKCKVYQHRRTARNSVVAMTHLADWLKSLPRPTGVFAANDETARQVLSACSLAGMKVPDRIALLGVDDDRKTCENAVPTITSIRSDLVGCGRLAVEQLAKAFAGESAPKTELYGPVRLIRRKSTARAFVRNEELSEILEVIRTDACRGLTASDVIARMKGGRRSAEIRFRAATGKSIHEAILSARLERVFDYLRQPRMAIGPIANLCGWTSSAHLKRHFRKVAGLSMREWRNRELN